jgi:hypothetical protein
MKERKELKKLVVYILQNNQEMTAKEIYIEIKKEHPRIIREENIRGFKSFAKIMGTFDEIHQIGHRGQPVIYKFLK